MVDTPCHELRLPIQEKAASMAVSTGDHGWEQLTNENWRMWEEGFTGKVHCAALLAFLKTLEYSKVDELIESTYKQISRVY